MNVDSILSMHSTGLMMVASFAPMLILAAGGIFVSLVVKSTGKSVAIAALLAVVCVGSGMAINTQEQVRVAQAQETVADGFDQAYGLQLDDRDLAALKWVNEKDLTRNLATPGGDLKHVLFRVVDDDVVPHTMDSEGTWIAMPAQPDALRETR